MTAVSCRHPTMATGPVGDCAGCWSRTDRYSWGLATGLFPYGRCADIVGNTVEWLVRHWEARFDPLRGSWSTYVATKTRSIGYDTLRDPSPRPGRGDSTVIDSIDSIDRITRRPGSDDDEPVDNILDPGLLDAVDGDGDARDDRHHVGRDDLGEDGDDGHPDGWSRRPKWLGKPSDWQPGSQRSDDVETAVLDQIIDDELLLDLVLDAGGYSGRDRHILTTIYRARMTGDDDSTAVAHVLAATYDITTRRVNQIVHDAADRLAGIVDDILADHD